jgi:gliding motility-associated-like protein
MKKLAFILLLVSFKLSSQTITGFDYGSSGNDAVESITSDSIGNHFVLGLFQNTITFDSAGTPKSYTSATTQSTYLVKFNCNNQFQWCLTVSSIIHSAFLGCVKARMNALFLVATYQGSTTITSSNNNTTTKSGGGSYAGLFLKINTNGVLIWANTIVSSTGKVELNDVDLSPSGSIYVAGLYIGVATASGQNATSVTTGTSVGAEDVLILKYNSAGETVWKQTGGGTGEDVAAYVKPDNNGHLYACGAFGCCGSATATFGSFTITNGTSWGGWLTQMDTSTGAYNWLIGQPGEQSVNGGIQVDENNYIYQTGYFSGTKTVKSFSTTGFTKTFTSIGGLDVYIAKYTPAGELLWAKTFGSTGDDYGWRSVYRKGKLYVHSMIGGNVSITQGSTTYTFTNAGSTDDILAIYDSTGVFLGGSIISGTSSERSQAMDYSDIGKLMIGGYFNGTIATSSVSLSSVGAQDGYMYIFDSTATKTSLIYNRTNFICLGDSVQIRTGLSAGTYSWVPAATLNNSSIASPFAKPTTNTTYILTYTSPGGCVYHDTARFFVDTISVSVSANTSICQNDSTQLNATGGTSYSWSPTTGLRNPNIANPFAKPSATTTYFVTIKKGACTAIDSVKITVNPLPVITTNNDTAFCIGNSKTLTATGTANRFLWNTGDTTSSITVTPTVTTTYWVRGQIGNIPCYSYDSVTIIVYPLPTIFTNNDTTFCQGTTKTLTTSGTANRFLWSTGDTTSTITVTPLVTTTYVVRGQVGNIPCYAYDTVKITVLPVPVISTNNDTTFCLGNSKTLTATGNSDHYLWSTGDTTASITVTPLVTTTYWVRGKKDTIPCYSFDSIKITVMPLPTIVTNNDTTFCLGNSKTLTTSGTANHYLWSTGDTTASITVTPLVTTTYWVRGQTDTIPCYTFDTVKITVLPIPTIFTNNDTTVCLGTFKTLTTSGTANHFLWSTGDTTASITVQPAVTTTYWVRGKRDTIPCYAFDTIKITVLPIPTIFTNKDTAICRGVLKTLTATGNSNRYYWNTGDTTSSITVSPLFSATYWVRGQNDTIACYAYATVNIIVLAIPLMDKKNDTTFCLGNSRTLKTNGTANRFLWSTGDTSANITVTPLVTTTYWVRGQTDNFNCFVTDTIKIIVLPLPTIFTNNDTTFCQGTSKVLKTTGTANRYLWSTGDTTASITVTPNITTTYWVRGQVGTIPCFTSDTVKITVLPLPIISINNDTAFCIGTSKTLTAKGNANSYLWSTGDITQSITVTPLVTTKYWVRGQTGIIPCYSSDTITITVYPLPTIKTNNDTAICHDISKILTTSGTANRYRWSTGDTTASITITPAITTTYWVRGQVGTIPCFTFDTVIITVIQRPVVDLGVDKLLCDGDVLTLTAPAGIPHLWSTGDTTKNINVHIVADTINFFPQKFWVREGAGPCYGGDTILIYAYPRPRILAAGKTTICFGSSIALRVNNIPPWAKLKWSTGDTTNIITVSPLSDSTFSVKYYNNECNFKDSIRIKVLAKPKITVSPDDTICPGLTILKVRGAKTYLWSTGATDSNVVVNATTTTTYWVIGNDGNCSSDTQRVTITVRPKAVASFTANPTQGFIPLTVQFTNLSTKATGYQWYFGNGDTSTQFSPSHIYKKKGIYTAKLIAFDSTGCNDTFSQKIIVEEKFLIIVPDVFTPDNNGLNDDFEIYYQAILSMDGKIYNRWGELVYEWHMPDGKWWDGKNGNRQVGAGVYYYDVIVIDEKNESHHYKGAVTLIR